MRKLFMFGLVASLTGLLGVGAMGARSANLPQWIRNDKVRSAYFSQWDSEELPGKIAEAGFNTMHITFCNGTDHFEKWARLARENQLHFFANIWFDYLAYVEAIHGPGAAGPKYGTLKDYRAFVHRDTGPAKLVVCPVDAAYWKNLIMPTPIEMAKLGVKYGGLDGVLIDGELYGPLNARPAISVSFYMDVGPCMCDHCFGDFLTQTRGKEKLADIPWKDRYVWLQKRKLTRDYNARLRDNVAALARQLEQQVHAVNPDLLLGLMNWYKNDIGAGPHENYFLHGLRNGLKTSKRPVMVWTEGPEYEQGYGSYTVARQQFFQSVGDVIYLPALYLEQHTRTKLPQQVHDLAMHSDGYWIFTRNMDLMRNPGILEQFKAGNAKIKESLSKTARPAKSERQDVMRFVYE